MPGTPAEKAAAIIAGAERLALTFTPVSNVSGGWYVFVGKMPTSGGGAPLLAINPVTGQLFRSRIGSGAIKLGDSGTTYLRSEFLELVTQ
jgi:hypothetical protein